MNEKIETCKNRNGKIEELPEAIREQLNDRLGNGQQNREILDWLNGLPEVQKVIAAEFDGIPVSWQNLSTNSSCSRKSSRRRS